MITFDGVSKTYRGLIRRRPVHALSDFSMTMERGEVVGIAGPNGAGKSTLISLVLGFLHPSGGRLAIAGAPPRRYVEHTGAGYLTELVNLPPRWKVTATLQRMATLAGASGAERTGRVNDVMSELGLDEHRDKAIRQLSKGNLQRVGLAQALLGDFDLVILDEPTHGLDPLWTQRFRDVVARLRRPDRLIVIASHNLDELERLADRVAILNKGQLQRVVSRGAASPVETAMAWRLVLEGSPDVLRVFPGATALPQQSGGWRLRATRQEFSAGVAQLLADGAVLVECRPEESLLETAFRSAVQS